MLSVLPDVPPGVPSSVEGLTVGPDGNIYVPTFGSNTKGALTGNAVPLQVKGYTVSKLPAVIPPFPAAFDHW